MAELYGLNDELPPGLGDEVLEDEKPSGPPNDENTASAGDDQ